MADVVTAVFKIAADDIKHNGRHGMPHMRVVINCQATDIHLDDIWLEGLEFFFLASEGVVKTNHMITLIYSRFYPQITQMAQIFLVFLRSPRRGAWFEGLKHQS